MIVSWNWLTQYVRLDMPVEVLVERLALAGLNHENTAEVGGDLAIDLEVTSNRPDCLNHLGIAREIAVLFHRTLLEPDPRPRSSGTPVDGVTGVLVETPELCSRFTARVISGVTVGESPWWLRKRLETLGIRPVSNIVDITNYVLFECGQPLHAYDLDQLIGHRLIVRQARPGESLLAINQRSYKLTTDMLVIADAERPVGLAGVMGGLDTEIGNKTRTILIESALFDSLSVRRTSRALGLTSPSSYRFERPMDPDRTEWASRRCAELVLELAGGTLHPGVIDVRRPPKDRPAISLRLDQIPRVLGIPIARPEVERILTALGLVPVADQPHRESLAFRPPSWRSDLEREIDLIEEVARVHGYEKIPENRIVPLARSTRGRRERVEAAIRETLCGLGFDEACTVSLVDDELICPLEPEAPPPLRVEHASRKKENALRVSLLPSLLAARAYNAAHGNLNACLFEIANVYLARNDRSLPNEPTRLGLVAGLDYYGLKGVVEALLARLHIAEPLEARPISAGLFASGRAAQVLLGETSLGWIGEIERHAFKSLELHPACGAELDLSVLIDRAVLAPRARRLPDYPAIARDLSLVVPVSLPWKDLASVAQQAAGPLLESIDFLDTFEGKDLPAGRHSLHFGLRFRHPERTLTGEEVDRSVRKVVEACTSRFEATLRS